MFLLYNLLLTLFSPFWAAWMLWRASRRKERPNWKERTGVFEQVPPRGEKPRIWFHAVSVGEVVAAGPILRELRRQLPNHEILVSVTTSSGHQTAREGDQTLFDYLVYFPIDVARFQLAAMQRVRPDAVLIMETELWMNFLWAAKVFDVRTMVVNGRISDRNFRISRHLSFFYRPLLSFLDRALMQNEVDAERIRLLGAKSVEVLGNCKFDEAAKSADADPVKWRAELGVPPGSKVLVVGSTRGEAEEELVVDAVKAVGLDRLMVIHAPRHLESATQLAERVQRTFGSVALRSKGETGPYLVLDSYGELASVYSVADIVVIGGGFENLGGQNFVQPLAQGKPVIHGTHMQNFREVAAMADAAGASIAVADAPALADALRKLLADPEERSRMGCAARELVQANVGASARYAKAAAEEIAKVPVRKKGK